MRVIVAAAGTGGHINPGIAIANKIKEKEPDSEIIFIGTNRGIENDLVPRAGYGLKTIEAYGFKKELSINNLKQIWQTFRRSIGTSLSTMLVLCSMFIFGTWVVQRFAFTVWVWVIASFLSSLFVAIPTAYILLRLTDKKIK